MYCPRCQIELSGDRCSSCGFEIIHLQDSSQQGATAASPQPAIELDSGSQPAAIRQSVASDWRSHIKRKLSEHTEKKQELNRSYGKAKRRNGSDQKVEMVGSERPLFDYRLSESTQKRSKRTAVRLVKKTGVSRAIAEKPVIRPPVRSHRTSRSQLPKQRALTLEVPLAPPAISSPVREEEISTPEVGISHEVIFSRLLAGMIDLLLPFLIAFIFTFSASQILNFDFFSANSVRLGALFSLCFFFLNSFFFLILSGQTPGMYLTDLQLVGEESKNVSFPSLALRILLFLPVAVTVLGLLWGVFDPWCRCVHDRASKTRIIPITPASS